jgi:hypothetical protein
MEALASEWNVNSPKQASGEASGYPGQRRQFSNTDGNALISAVSVNGGAGGNNDLVSGTFLESVRVRSFGRSKVVWTHERWFQLLCFTVTVPEGIAPGQTIAVLAPDGSRLVKATIPPGLHPGDTFLVRLATPIQADTLNAQPLKPPAQTAPQPGQNPIFANALDTYMTPAPNHPNFANALENWIPASPAGAAAMTAPDASEKQGQNGTAEAVATAVNTRGLRDPSPTAAGLAVVSPPPTPAPQAANNKQILGQPVNAQIEVAETRQEPEAGRASSYGNNAGGDGSGPPTNLSYPNDSSPKQKLLLVHVPQGMPAGSAMQVEVPGENRTITAQVPAGVPSFHVAYTPRPLLPTPSQQQAPSQSRTPSPPTMAPSPPPPPPRHRAPTTSMGQRLLLVRVPPGTQAGTTLHVSVPDEPGRILAAQVPPGNVQEFHVSYEARVPQQASSNSHNGSTQRSGGGGSRGGPAPATNGYGQPPPPSQPGYYGNSSSQQQPSQQFFPQNSGNHYVPQQQPPVPQHHQQQRMAPYNNNYQNNDRTQPQNGAGNNLFLPFLGGAALGAAGMATYDHFAHNGDSNANDPTDYGGAGGADYGGDYGGDYDMGGGDFGF